MEDKIIYNKDQNIRDIISNEKYEKYVIMMLDFDNISKFCDAYCKAFCKILLEEAINIIRKNICKSDRLIEINYKRYEVLLLDKGIDEALCVGCEICHELNRLYAGENKNLKFTASIGMSCYDKNTESSGKTYDDILWQAKLALNQVMNTTKNNIQCYSRLDNSQIQEQAEYHIHENSTIEQNYIKIGGNNDLVIEANEILSKTKDFRSGLAILFGKLCHKYGFNVIRYITYDRICMNKTIQFEWNDFNQTIKTYKEENVFEADEFEQYIESFNQRGVYVLEKDALPNMFRNNKGMKYRIHFAHYQRGLLYGALSLEKDEETIDLKRIDIIELKKLSNLVSDKLKIYELNLSSATKTQFFSRMSHDIRTPVSIIMGISDMLRDEIKQNMPITDKISGYLDKIDYSSRYMLGLMNDILELSKLENKKFKLVKEYFEVKSFCKSILEVITFNAQRNGINLVYYGDKGDIEVFGDNLRVKEIIINLINNAIRKTPKGGKIYFSTEVIEKNVTDKLVTIRFSIKDTGVGIEKKDIEHIFEPYMRNTVNNSDDYDGLSSTGLGLSICKNLVDIMGGKISVKSEVGVGSEFYFDLPFLYRENTGNHNVFIDTYNQEILNMDCSGMRVLLTEDHDINVMVEKHLLVKSGFLVETASNGQEAVDKFKSSTQFYYDMILMDIRMPVMGGLEATALIRKSGRADAKKVLIFATTANDFDEDERKSKMYGMNGHITKPLKINALKKLLYLAEKEKNKKE